MISAGLYHRVSTTDQDSTLARDELQGAARARDLVVALDVEETGSGARNDRPGLARILDAARRGRINAVLVWKLDRFGRSALDVLSNIRTLEDAGCRFVAVTQGIDIKPGGDPMSRLLLTMLAAIAEFERELIVERTRLGLAKANAAGRHGGRPLGPHAPDPATVAAMRAKRDAAILTKRADPKSEPDGLKHSWKWLAKHFHCSSSAVQRAYHRAVDQGLISLPENGVTKKPAAPVEKPKAE